VLAQLYCIYLLKFFKKAFPLCLLFSITSHAQFKPYTNQQHFGVEDGLPQGYVSGITQDKDGFLWFGTLDGICRYDGRGFRIFRYRPNDSTSFSANTIHSFGPKINNTVTLLYEGYREDDFDLSTFKITRKNIRNQLRSIPGGIWQVYGTNAEAPDWSFIINGYKGIGWITSADEKTHYANRTNGLLHDDTVTAMVQSPAGKLFTVSSKGVHVSDTAKKKFGFIPFDTQIKNLRPYEEPSLYHMNYATVYLNDNRLAVLIENKLTMLDLSQRRSTVYTLPPISSPALKDVPKLSQVDHHGMLYFAHGEKVYRMNKDGQLTVLWENAIFPGLRISALYIDRSDVLWVGVNAQGVFKIDLQARPFQSYHYKTFYLLDILDFAGAGPVRPASWQEESSYQLRQAYDSKGNLYITANFLANHDAEMLRMDKQGFHLFSKDKKTRSDQALVIMPGDEVWNYDQWTSSWNIFTEKNGSKPINLPLVTDTLTGEVADAHYIGGYIWMSTYNEGLFQFQREKKINRFFGLQPAGLMPKNLTEICPDPRDKNKFWIGSRGGGMVLWDINKGLERVFTIEDGLPNNTIYCILADRSGKIWCSSNKGIFRFDPATKEVRSFEMNDGLPGNEFNRAHKFQFPDGRMVFGALDGFVVFNPSDFEKETSKENVPVVLTALQINNQQQDVNIAGSLTQQPLPQLSSINLPYNKNYLRFEFSAMLFNQPQKTRYRYQLVGADAGWIENGTNNIASYAALRPGKYTLKLNATDNNGIWSDSIKEIVIRINPPFWFTWWAYLIYALIALFLLRTYFIFRERRIKAEQNLAFEKREAHRLKELDELKDRFFSNITHEFRTPLTLIISPLEKLSQDSSLSPAAINSVKTAQRNSQQLLRLINEFLDFSKLNEGQLQLRLSTGELDLFTAERVESFETVAAEKNIDLSFSNNGVSGFYLFDENKWEKIVVNLVGNALKFTPSNGKVSVRLAALEGNNIQLEVEDNGPGIPPEHQQKVFDRFYQVDNSSVRISGGTGIGLSLVKELTGLMNGEITLRSDAGRSTVFNITVPLVKQQVELTQAATQPIVSIPATNGEDEPPLLLITEDNDELRRFIVESMQPHYRVIQTNNGHSAAELALQELPDIIISDVMMPGQDGFDLCRVCKTDNRTAHIGFILLTAKAAHDARLKGLGMGADDYITKPFHLEELRLRVANLLQLQQKQRVYLQATLINASPEQELPAITDPFLQQLYQEMDAKLDDPELGVDYLCKAVGMSKSTLNRKLKSLLDISTNQLIRQYRLQKAGGFLSAGMDIASVAYKVGFSTPSYFSQSFKEQYGITPSEYVTNNISAANIK
jgi:signal transduction histidine kinase/DNA-binding response OmpR family regulator/ligand-binding sensor domain-containing protein